MSNRISPAAFARLHGVSRQRVMQWIAAGRLPRAEPTQDALGKTVWTIPSTAKRPPPAAPGGLSTRKTATD